MKHTQSCAYIGQFMAATQKLPLPFAAQLDYDAMVDKGTDVDGSSSNKY